MFRSLCVKYGIAVPQPRQMLCKVIQGIEGHPSFGRDGREDFMPFVPVNSSQQPTTKEREL
jgi:hypothetical protein